eukprot:TRINITY_DN78269_c0_g1_i1.p1 TRINITY_DN78269_c0_g1~~TRINITY_DN78269_c0_g1_i1.p1  ORF type:complete len:107 (+),score=34.70 TRINITY_DN78269_c0_g1_i1:76-396(+)
MSSSTTTTLAEAFAVVANAKASLRHARRLEVRLHQFFDHENPTAVLDKMKKLNQVYLTNPLLFVDPADANSLAGLDEEEKEEEAAVRALMDELLDSLCVALEIMSP